MVTLDTMFHDIFDKDPRAMPIDYANFIDAGDGTRPGSGWSEQKWVWGRISETFWTSLTAFFNTVVYIDTRKNDGTFGHYTATMVRSGAEPEHYAGRVINAEILFRNLVAYTP